MITQTKTRIIGVIEQDGPSRPVELAKALQISPQALHRHLNVLVHQKILERRGRPPFTAYGLAGIFDFSKALKWASALQVNENPTQTVCETRDVFAARLSRLARLVDQGLDQNELSLLIAIVGEVGNNSFDHNLGQWLDLPGVWFEELISSDRVGIILADRGQGVLNSLRRVAPEIQADRAALEVAFEKRVSGRMPEQRGNGLKFVRDSILRRDGRGIACLSGSGWIEYGELGKSSLKALDVEKTRVPGTVTLISWRHR